MSDRKQISKLCYFVFGAVLLYGCASSPKSNKTNPIGQLLNTSEEETTQDAFTALKSISGAMTGQELSQEQMEELSKQIRHDEKAQTAIIAITDSLEANKVKIKYSPATGKRYSADMEFCPETGVKLLPLE